MKKSMDSRLAFARENNQYAAQALLNKTTSVKAPTQTFKAKKPPTPQVPSSHKGRPKSESFDDEEFPKYICVCNRQAQVVVCGKCKMLFYGRVSEVCPRHPNVSLD